MAPLGSEISPCSQQPQQQSPRLPGRPRASTSGSRLRPAAAAMPRTAVRTALLCVALLPAGLAWDKDGHEAIGMTTMSALQQGPTAQIKRLMGGKDAVDVAGWAHKVNKKYPWTSELHFQRQKTWRCKTTDLSVCPGNKCLVQALKHFYGRLIHKPTVDIEWPAGMKLTDADCVKYIINLMGDLHQPLHFGAEMDDMGRNTTVLFRGKTVSLYDIWDREITQAVIKDSPGFWWGGWTHVQRTRIEYEQDGAKWKTEGTAMIDKWADETVQYVCDKVYKNPLTGHNILEEVKDGVFRLDENLFETWKREMLSKMLVAGARTAIVLNSVLQAREAGNLHAGSDLTGVEGEDDKDEKSNRPAPVGRKNEFHGMKPIHGAQAFGINFGIGSVVVVIFLQVMRVWWGTDQVKQADRLKASGAAGGKKT